MLYKTKNAYKIFEKKGGRDSGKNPNCNKCMQTMY